MFFYLVMLFFGAVVWIFVRNFCVGRKVRFIFRVMLSMLFLYLLMVACVFAVFLYSRPDYGCDPMLSALCEQGAEVDYAPSLVVVIFFGWFPAAVFVLIYEILWAFKVYVYRCLKKNN